jgi:hypothetical protein
MFELVRYCKKYTWILLLIFKENEKESCCLTPNRLHVGDHCNDSLYRGLIVFSGSCSPFRAQDSYSVP